MRFPDDQQRISLVGRTGSGKTRAGVFHLSLRRPDLMPWITIDFKRDDLIARIPGIKILGLNDPIPETGFYVVRPMPHESEEVQAFLWRVWERGHVGLYVDEGYMLDDSPALRAILTQGRSKHIPVIILSQRPVWMSRFVFSEADFVQLFHLNDERDLKNVRAFMPDTVTERLEPYHSWYYDIGQNELTLLAPVPDDETILKAFEKWLPPEPQTLENEPESSTSVLLV